MGQGHQKEEYPIDIGIQKAGADRIANHADPHAHVSHNIADLLIFNKCQSAYLNQNPNTFPLHNLPPCHTAAHRLLTIILLLSTLEEVQGLD